MKTLILLIALSVTVQAQKAIGYEVVTQFPGSPTDRQTVIKSDSIWTYRNGEWRLLRVPYALIASGGVGSVDTTVIATQNDLHTEVDSVKANRSLIGHTHAAGGYTLVAKLANDAATGANVTPISLSGLVFNFAANSTYRIEFYGNISPAAATTGCGFQFDVSAAVTSISLSFHHQLANTGTLSGGSSIADDASAGVSSGMPANGGVYPVVGAGIIITGANTGTAQLRFRSETTAVTTAKAGLTLVVEKIQ